MHVSNGAHAGQRHQIFLELQLQAMVSLLTWVLETDSVLHKSKQPKPLTPCIISEVKELKCGGDTGLSQITSKPSPSLICFSSKQSRRI